VHTNQATRSTACASMGRLARGASVFPEWLRFNLRWPWTLLSGQLPAVHPSLKPVGVESSLCLARSLDAIAKTQKNSSPTQLCSEARWNATWNFAKIKRKSSVRCLKTVRRLKELGFRHIVVFGPGPLWTTSLPVYLFRSMVRTRSKRNP